MRRNSCVARVQDVPRGTSPARPGPSPEGDRCGRRRHRAAEHTAPWVATLVAGTALAVGVRAAHPHPTALLQDLLVSWPVALLVTTAALAASRRLVSWAGLASRPVLAWLAEVLPAAALYAVVGPPPFASTDSSAALAFVVGTASLTLARAAARSWPRRRKDLAGLVRRAGLATVAVGGMTAALVPAPAAGTVNSAASQAAVAACGETSADRVYDVAAINVHIPYNRWGQGNPHGQVYVLQGDKSAVKNWDKPLGSTGDNRRLRPRPLVIRANEGECVRVNFTNELDDVQGEGMAADPRASMSVRGVPYDVQTSGGSHAGYNDDTTVPNDPGSNTVTYYCVAPREGSYFFNDTGNPAGSEADGGSLGNGLYGAFVVEPAGSTWTDPVSGRRLYSETGDLSGELYIDAVITPPTGKSFRESVQLAQDELPTTSAFAFNYGSEPGSARETGGRCPDCVGEETSLSSWTYGDPAMVKLASGLGPWRPGTPEGAENCGLGTEGFVTDSCFTSNVTHAYVGDPIKFRYGLAGVYETHVFHMHAHTWLADPDDVGAAGSTPTKPTPDAPAESNTIDSQTFGPMEMFTADLLYGAGGKAGTVGDSIFHCHLYPHFADGFWSLFRIHDVLEDGTGTTPDGVRVAALRPLADTAPTSGPDARQPRLPALYPGHVRVALRSRRSASATGESRPCGTWPESR